MTSVVEAVNPLKPGSRWSHPFYVPPVPWTLLALLPLNHIALLLDESLSMRRLASKVREMALEQIAAIKKAAYGSGQETRVSIYSFTTDPSFPSEKLKLITHVEETHPEAALLGNYQPCANTPLNDAVRAVSERLNRANQNRPDESFLLITLTDGEENTSKNGPIGTLVQELQRKGNWTFAFLVPPGNAAETARKTGVPIGNIREWEATEEGLRGASRDTVDGTQSYYAARAAGAKSTPSFFTDASKLKPTAVAKKLDDISKNLRHWKVEAEQDISTFVTDKIGTYDIGKAYYELTKSEAIQSHKDLILQNIKTKKYFGGDEAKALLGIASGPGVTARVKPGNHGEWKIFVKSTSMNRKLVRGTTLLYQK